MLAVFPSIVTPLLTLITYIAAILVVPREGEDRPLTAEFSISRHKHPIPGLILIIGAAIAGSTLAGSLAQPSRHMPS